MKNLILHSHAQNFTKSSFALSLKIATIVIATLTIFYQDLAIVVNDALQSEFVSYILAIPFIFIYLIYRKRKILGTVIALENQNQSKIKHLSTISGVLLCITAMLTYWYGSYTFTPLEYHMIALPIFVAGLCLIFFNMRTLRQLAFPIAFLAFLTPPPLEVFYALGSKLSIASSEASYFIIRSLGIPSTIINEYGTPIIQITRPNGATLSFAVDVACSGIYSLIGFLIFALFIVYVIRDKPWKRLVLFIVGIVLIYLLNITRITIILLIGYHQGEEMALQLFHLFGGWILVFIGTLLLLTISGKIFHTQIFTKAQQKCLECNLKPPTNQNFCFTCGKILKPAPMRFRRTDIVKIGAIVVSLTFLMSIQAPVFALTQGPAMVLIDTPMGQQVSAGILPEISGYNLSFVYRDREFETIAKQDMALVYIYSPINQSGKAVYVTIEIAASLQNLYRWEICLKVGQMHPFGYQETTQIDLKDISLLQNPPLISRFLVFQYTSTNRTQAVLYWFESATFKVNSTSQYKHIKISVITYPESLEDLQSIENQMVTLATAVTSYWQPIKAWSQIALLLSQESLYLATITGALLIVIILLYAWEKRQQKKANGKAYQKLSKPNKQIVDIISETEKATTPTFNAIATTYKSKIGESIEESKLLQKLSEVEKTGIIESAIANIRDEPTQIWKTFVFRSYCNNKW